MASRAVLAWALAWTLTIPGMAAANHVEEYRYHPVEHDDQGRSDEPDFESTSVLGPLVDNCFLELPVAGAFEGRCTRPLPLPVPGQAAALAPGCTGAAPDGRPERRLSGQCGLWTVGYRETLVGLGWTTQGYLVPPQAPLPVSERGMPGSAAPGAFTPTKASAVRFLDGHFQSAVSLPLTTITRLDVNHKLADAAALAGLGALAGLRGAMLPGERQSALWYGQWQDRNGNGVIDHVSPGTAGTTQNEFAWLGSCIDYETFAFNPSAIPAGLCIEDPNPHSVPPGTRCGPSPPPQGCARTTVVEWHWPGNHHASGAQWPLPSDIPGQQAVHWFVDECDGYTGCDEPDVLWRGDPVLGPQDARLVDGYFGDFTGSYASARSDIFRDWHPGNGPWYGHSHLFYGDDGLLLTMLSVYGANCAEVVLWYAYEPGTCTFTDVDRHEGLHPALDLLLLGSVEQPTGGLKGAVRGAWVLVRGP